MNYHYYRQFYKKALYPSSWRVIGAKLSKYALIYVCITVFLVASVSAEDSQELSSSQTYEQITVVAKNELIQKPITDLEHKAVEGKKDVSTSSWTKVIVEGAEASLVHPSEFADQPKTLVFEKDNKAFVSNPDNPVAKVTFTPHAKVVDERENPISFSEFSPPTRLQPAEELYVDEHLPHVQVHSVYHVGDFDPLFVQGKTATKAMATVQLPFPENVLGGEVKVYSSQD